MTAFRCPVCAYSYDEALGAPREGFPAGTRWDSVPEDWCCPDCGVREKIDFEPIGASAPPANASESMHERSEE